MKSPLSGAALTVTDLSELIDAHAAYIEFDGMGNLTDSIVYAGLNSFTIDEVADDKIIGTTRMGWKEDYPFTTYGLAPDEFGNWSTQYCVVPFEVAMQLMHDWVRDHATLVPVHDLRGYTHQMF